VATDTATKPTTITFISQARAGGLVRREPEEIIGMNGTRIPKPNTALRYDFEEGERYGLGTLYGCIRVEPGQDELPVSGLTPEQDPDGETEDAATWIRRHPLFGERIWEHDPDAPDPTELLQQIAGYAFERDVAKLVELYETEDAEDGWKRPPVLTAIENALKAADALANSETAQGTGNDSDALRTAEDGSEGHPEGAE
jgi:hypothetical protein